MGLRKDIWRPAIVRAPFDTIVERGTLDGLAMQWLPETPPFTFLADPFGMWRGDHLHLFVETYDYRVRVGSIDVLTFDSSLTLLDHRPALREPWHLSYPIVFEADGETWMMPEAHRSLGLTIYRATGFPYEWKPAHRVMLDHVPVDATPLFHEGRWWLFYTVADSEFDKMGSLHCAFAPTLAGPWTPHPLNPVRQGLDRSRPGGTALVRGDRILLPVQDCSRTYGGGLSVLSIRITPSTIEFQEQARFSAPASFAPFTEGLHTLAEAGPVTLVDAKRTELSVRGLAIEARREWSKLKRR